MSKVQGWAMLGCLYKIAYPDYGIMVTLGYFTLFIVLDYWERRSDSSKQEIRAG